MPIPTVPQFEFNYTHVDNLPVDRWSCMFSQTDCRREMRQQGYYLQTVVRVDLCATCVGSGKRQHKHNRLRFVICPTCKGKAERGRVTITHADQDLE